MLRNQRHRDRNVPGCAHRREAADGLDDLPVGAAPDPEPLVGRVAAVHIRERLGRRSAETLDAGKGRDHPAVHLTDQSWDDGATSLVDRGGVDAWSRGDRPDGSVSLAPRERRLSEPVEANAGVTAAGDRDPVRSDVERPTPVALVDEQRGVGEQRSDRRRRLDVFDDEKGTSPPIERVPETRDDHRRRRVVDGQRLDADRLVAALRNRRGLGPRLRASDVEPVARETVRRRVGQALSRRIPERAWHT